MRGRCSSLFTSLRCQSRGLEGRGDYLRRKYLSNREYPATPSRTGFRPDFCRSPFLLTARFRGRIFPVLLEQKLHRREVPSARLDPELGVQPFARRRISATVAERSERCAFPNALTAFAFSPGAPLLLSAQGVTRFPTGARGDLSGYPLMLTLSRRDRAPPR
jgi:hypothetical protein